MKICLIIIYNHNFERNIPVLERVYRNRFQHVYHVMPFYRGDAPNVIGVYECSYRFSGYIAQAYSRLQHKGFTHFVIAADDMVLNPKLNEGNIIEELELDEQTGFLDDAKIFDVNDLTNWTFGWSSVAAISALDSGSQSNRLIPTLKEAQDKIASHGFNVTDSIDSWLYRVFRYGIVMPKDKSYKILLDWKWRCLWRLRRLVAPFAKKINCLQHCGLPKLYPILKAYSDFVIIPAIAMDDFAHYSGVFASINMFVENAIPTSLALSCNKLKYLRDTRFKAEEGIYDYSIREKLERNCEFSYKRLIETYPEDYLFVHPIKLSKWKDLP